MPHTSQKVSKTNIASSSNATPILLDNKAKKLWQSLMAKILTEKKEEFDATLEEIKKHKQKKLILSYEAFSTDFFFYSVDSGKARVQLVSGTIPLFYAMERIDPYYTERLLQADADPNHIIQKTGIFQNKLPLAFAISSRNQAILSCVLAYGANPLLVSSWPVSHSQQKFIKASALAFAIYVSDYNYALPLLLEKVGVHQKENETSGQEFANIFPLSIAIRRKNIVAIKLLIEKFRMNLTQISQRDATFLEEMVALLPEDEALNILEFCQELGVIDLAVDPHPLYWAAEYGKLTLVKKLSEKIQNINTEISALNKEGYNVLTGACLSGNFDFIQKVFPLLLEKGAKPNDETLRTAARFCSINIVQFLLENTDVDSDEMKIDVMDDDDIKVDGALIKATLNDDIAVALLLLKKSKYSKESGVPEDVQRMRAIALSFLLKKLQTDEKYAAYAFLFLRAAGPEILKMPVSNKNKIPFYFRALSFPNGVKFLKNCLDHFPDKIDLDTPIAKEGLQEFSMLSIAVLCENIALIDLLLKQPNIKKTVNTLRHKFHEFKNIVGLPLLALSLRNQVFFEVADLLIQAGADVNATVTIGINETKEIPLLLFLMLQDQKEAFNYLLDKKLNKETLLYTLQVATDYKLNAYKKMLQSKFPGLTKELTAFFKPAALDFSAISTLPSTHATSDSIQAESDAVELVINEFLPIQTVLLKHAFYIAQRIDSLLKDESPSYYLALMHMLRLSEALYGYVRQTQDEKFISRKDAFYFRNIAAHLFHSLDDSNLLELLRNLNAFVFPKLLAYFNKQEVMHTSFVHSPLYKKLIKKLPEADCLLQPEALQHSVLMEMSKLGKRLEAVDQLQWIITSQNLVDEVMMRYAIIGQYARLLDGKGKLFEIPEVKAWLQDCMLVRNIVAHEFSENDDELNARIFLPNKINREGFFYMANGLRRIQPVIDQLISSLEPKLQAVPLNV